MALKWYLINLRHFFTLHCEIVNMYSCFCIHKTIQLSKNTVSTFIYKVKEWKSISKKKSLRCFLKKLRRQGKFPWPWKLWTVESNNDTSLKGPKQRGLVWHYPFLSPKIKIKPKSSTRPVLFLEMCFCQTWVRLTLLFSRISWVTDQNLSHNRQHIMRIE